MLFSGCLSAEPTQVAFVNAYPGPAGPTLYRATWGAVRSDAPLAPGAAAAPQDSVAASENLAYAILAPDWDPQDGAPPRRLVLLQSRQGYGVHLHDRLRIAVDDAGFLGNCAVGAPLSQQQADVIARLVFPDVLAGRHYDAATCSLTAPEAASGS